MVVSVRLAVECIGAVKLGVVLWSTLGTAVVSAALRASSGEFEIEAAECDGQTRSEFWTELAP